MSVCAGVDTHTAELNFREIILSRGGKIHGEYKNNKLEVECKDGYHWYVEPRKIAIGRWCPTCKQSRGEYEISTILNMWNIQYKREVLHPLIPGKRYDFYFLYEGISYLIEFDGIQYFEYAPFFHDSVEHFTYKQNIDRLKTYVALLTNYYIIRIDYTKLNNVKDCLLQALQNKQQLYTSSTQIYSWLLGSVIPIDLIQKNIHNYYQGSVEFIHFLIRNK